MKNLLALIIVLTFFSCSTNDGEGCANWYYVYTYEECSCAIDDEDCQTYYLLNDENYNCLNTYLLESIESCVFIDNSVCNEINFNGYIRTVNKECFKIDTII